MGKLIAAFILLAVVLATVFVHKVDLINRLTSTKQSAFNAAEVTSTGRSPFAINSSSLSPVELGKMANPEYLISFPKDHTSHDEFDIEWWYLTANLQDEDSNHYALQWTLFRFRNPNMLEQNQSAWHDKQIFMAHASVHSDTQHWFSEKFARGKVGNAGVETTPFSLYIDEWRWLNNAPIFAGDQLNRTHLLPAELSFNAALISSSKDISQAERSQKLLNVKLDLVNTGPFVLQGDNGFSIKSADGRYASHYYSAPFIKVEGSIDFGVNADKVIKRVKGNAWFDQEWTSQLLDSKTLGWDWLSLHLDNGDKLMAFRMRIEGQKHYVTGSYIHSNGKVQKLKPSEISLTPNQQIEVGNKQLPLSWHLEIPSKELRLDIVSSKADQWNPALIPYYEGSVEVSGSQTGIGFLELTGY